MNRPLVVVVLILLALPAAALLANVQFYDLRVPPRLSLPDAYPLAVKALGADAKRFHCTSAFAGRITGPRDGEWSFLFYSPDGQEREVVVAFDKRAEVFSPVRRVFSANPPSLTQRSSERRLAGGP